MILSNEHEASRRCKAELLVQLDGLESSTGNMIIKVFAIK